MGLDTTSTAYTKAEALACTASPLSPVGFNASCNLPYGLQVSQIQKSMQTFIDFLTFVNSQLNSKKLERLEVMLMAANFSSLVGEFMSSNIPKNCASIIKNTYHNGHPDLVPANYYAKNSVLHGPHGIELKASRYTARWQGHNPEDVWLMVFIYESNRPPDASKGRSPMPFRFVEVVGEKLTKSDWTFAGRSETSRRTITASVNPAAATRMRFNYIYRAP